MCMWVLCALLLWWRVIGLMGVQVINMICFDVVCILVYVAYVYLYFNALFISSVQRIVKQWTIL